MFRRLVPTVFLALAFASPWTPADEKTTQDQPSNQKISIVPRSAVGDSFQFDRTREEQMNFTDADGKTDFSHTLEHSTGTMVVTAVKDGIPIACRLTYDPKCTVKTIGDDGSTTTAESPLAGKTITLRMIENKVVDDLKDSIDDDTREYMHDVLNPDADNFPDGPVAVGDSWETSAKVSKHAGLGPDDRILSHTKLDGIKTVDGARLGEMSFVVADLRHDDPGEESTYAGEGTYRVDLDHGVIIHADATGTIKVFPTPGTADKSAKPFHGEGFDRDREKWTPTWAGTSPATQPAP